MSNEFYSRSLNLYIFFAYIHQRALISLAKCSQVTQILHCGSVLPVICLAFNFWNNAIFLAFPCAVHYDLGNSVLRTNFQNTYNHLLSSPIPFPSSLLS